MVGIYHTYFLNCLTILCNESIIVTIKKNGIVNILGRLMDRHNADGDKANISFANLTPRELSILKCLARGMSDHEIASQLFLSLNTIKWYNRKIFIKLGVCSRTQAIARGHDLHLLTTDPSSDHLPV